jgi:hypothetical protein
MPQHLILPDPRRLPSRRASGAGGGGPQRQRGEHGRHLRQQLQSIVQAPSRLDQGVDPALVFKIRAASRPTDTAFDGRGLQLLGETVDYTYFVLADGGATTLASAIGGYRTTGNLSSFFDLINDIELYGSEDRRGPGVDELAVGDEQVAGDLHTVDVSVWPAADYQEATRRLQIVEAVLARVGGQIQLRSVSARRTYLRVSTTLDGVNDLLETSVVELVRSPPVPFLDFREWRDVATDELDRDTEPSAVVGILDDALADGHPLLTGLVLSTDDLAPSSYVWQKPGSHGTEVAGRAVYPGLPDDLRNGRTITAYGAVRGMRILEPDPGTRGGTATRFATYALPHELIAEGIRYLHSEHGVRVFNLSVGYADPFDAIHVGPLTEIIDDLVRELNIVVVVPTGNAPISRDARTPSGHHIRDDKPRYFFSAEHRLSEPGPAALAVTVGSVALSGAAAELANRIGWLAAAEENEASPFSRTGPGIGTTTQRRNKPDVVHYGGNVVVNDTGNTVPDDPGASLVSTSFRQGDGRLFAAVNGTSFAVPAVARVAADIAHEYPEASANLIRALLASGTTEPSPAARISNLAQRAQVYGLGTPTRERATTSGATRVTMTYDGAMAIDTVQIHPLALPELFRRGNGAARTITIALAFDPPVRRQRREYLAGSMKLDIYRDIDADELAEILVKQDPDDPTDLITGRRRLTLAPGSNSYTNSTLQLRRWTRTNSFATDDETFYLVVTHRAQTWARNDPGYQQQNYALAVTLEDQALVQADLYSLLTQQVLLPARVRVRA